MKIVKYLRIEIKGANKKECLEGFAMIESMCDTEVMEFGETAYEAMAYMNISSFRHGKSLVVRRPAGGKTPVALGYREY